jgi:drug/metabolite transporter (DMT)-like permease
VTQQASPAPLQSSSPAAHSKRDAKLAVAALVLVCLIWGSTFTIIKEVLQDVSPLLFLTLRFGVAAVALWAALRTRGPLPLDATTLGPGALLGLAMCGGFVFQTLGLQFTTPSRSAFLTGLFIVIVPLLGAAIRRTLPGRSELAGVGIAFLGMGLLSTPLGRMEALWGDFLTVLCAVCYAVHILMLGYFARTRDLRALAFLQIAFTFLISLALFSWAEPVVFHPSPRLLLAVLFTGVLATAVAFFVQTWAQRITSPTRTALIFALEPVFAWATAFVVLGEVLSSWHAIGAGLILLAVLMVELQLLNLRTSKANETSVA